MKVLCLMILADKLSYRIENAAYLAAFLCLILLSGCSSGPEADRLSGRTMGTSWSVVIANRTSDHDKVRLQSGIEAELLEVNRQMSTYDPVSEISQFNASKVLDAWFPVSKLFAATTANALRFAHISKGAFDPTVAPLVNIWGFGPEAIKADLPSDEEVAEAKAMVGFQSIAVRPPEANGGPALKKSAFRHLDLSAIAKGLGVDQVYKLIDRLGYTDFLVEIGGEIRVKGDKNGLGWKIAVEQPNKIDSQVQTTLYLSDVALATSGDYRNYREIDGIAYSHTIDPSSGYPVTHDLASVTVVDEECVLADAWATTLLVLGLTEGYAMAVRQGLSAMFITRTTEGFLVRYTPRFERLLTGMTK